MRHPQGFSLIELSIVLVILGLLTGGILAGQSLIRASELRAVSDEYQRYTITTGAFRDKYFAIPGDMTNATQFWGTAAVCPGTNASPSTTATTCNGDGNGRLLTTAPNSNEIFRFWQHLANAGLIEGSYSGVSNSATATTNVALIGVNGPKSKMGNGGWSVASIDTRTVADTIWFDGNYGNVLLFGTAATNWQTVNPILKPEEAWNLDTKFDDGKPATGNVLSREDLGNASGTGCSDMAVSTTVSLSASAYSLSNTAISCMLIFKLGY